MQWATLYSTIPPATPSLHCPSGSAVPSGLSPQPSITLLNHYSQGPPHLISQQPQGQLTFWLLVSFCRGGQSTEKHEGSVQVTKSFRVEGILRAAYRAKSHYESQGCSANTVAPPYSWGTCSKTPDDSTEPYGYYVFFTVHTYLW